MLIYVTGGLRAPIKHRNDMANLSPLPVPPLPADQILKRIEKEREQKKAEFIRETSANVLVELIARNPKSPAISAVISVDAAELLAKALENKDYL